jgi:hypothetical protein
VKELTVTDAKKIFVKCTENSIETIMLGSIASLTVSQRQGPILSAAFVGILSCMAVALLTKFLGGNGKALIAASVEISVLMFAFVFVLSVGNLRNGGYREAIRFKGEVFGCFGGRRSSARPSAR